MKRLLCLPCFTLFICLVSPGCSAQKELGSTDKKALKAFEEGKEAYIRRDYARAETQLQKAIAIDPGFTEAYLFLADTYLSLGTPDKGEENYRKALDIDSVKYVKAFLALANLYDTREEYRKELAAYKSYLNNKEKLSASQRKDLENTMKGLEMVISFVDNPVPFEPVNLGPQINSELNEYHPSFAVDGSSIYFTVDRVYNKPPCHLHTAFHQEDLYYSRWKDTAWEERKPLPNYINTMCSEGASAFSPDGNYLFFAGDNRNPSAYQSFEIFYCVRTGNTWSKPINPGPPINTDSYESTPTFSSDGKTMIFTSARPGGRGKQDLLISFLQPNGSWSEPYNMGDSINTPGAEMNPFLHPDGRTLYFTSDGHPGLGKSDIFFSRLLPDGRWTKARNLGYPINTREAELSMVVSADGTTAYYASERPEGYGGLDIYKFELYPDARPTPVTYLKGKVFDKNTLTPLKATFQLIDLKTGQTLVQSVSDEETGEFLVCIPTGNDYALKAQAENYLFFSENFTLTGTSTQTQPQTKNIPLVPIEEGGTVVLRNIFFDTDKFDLKQESRIELDYLVELLQKTPRMQIEISGHTDNQGAKQHNLTLSQNRARAVVNYLVSKGIAANRLTAKGYGDTMPIAENNTENGRAQNRRTEFKVTGL